MNKKAFVDTTILADVLLKPSEKGPIASAALSRFDETLLPVYAIKEFKAGVLSNFQWIHNKLASTRSFTDTMAALHAMSMTPRKYRTATAIEAIKEASHEILKGTIGNSRLTKTYGRMATEDEVLCDRYRLSIKRSITKAWKRRRQVTSRVVEELSCYSEQEPTENKGLIEVEPTKCTPERECCLAAALRKKNTEIKSLVSTIDPESTKSEDRKRRRILNELSRKPKQLVSEDYCRALGDAYFALFCPQDATILTTNIKDHQPLAEALKKSAEAPQRPIAEPKAKQK